MPNVVGLDTARSELPDLVVLLVIDLDYPYVRLEVEKGRESIISDWCMVVS
jgi:hypothetical protein